MSQPQLEPLFDTADFDKYQWAEILGRVSSKECQNYSKGFLEEAGAYQASGDTLAHEIFKFLSEITSVVMEPPILMEPLEVKQHNYHNYVEKLIESLLSKKHLSVLRELISKIDDPEMRARVADVLWICKQDSERARPIQMAREAVKAYLQSARNLEDVENEMNCYARLKRAAQLAPLIDGKRNTEMRCEVVEHINDLISRYATVENEFLTGSAMKVLQEDLDKSLSTIQIDLPSYAAKCANIAAQKALFAEGFEDYHEAFYQRQAYRQIESEWYKIANDKEAERKVRIHLAEDEVWYAQQVFVANEPDSYSVAAGRIESAIKALKTIEDTFNRRQDTSKLIQDLHKKMLDYQKQSMAQTVTAPIGELENFHNLDIQKAAREQVGGKSLRDALYFLAFGIPIRRTEDLQAEAEQSMKPSKLSHLTPTTKLSHVIPTTLVDEEGKTKAVIRNGETALKDTMFRIAKSHQVWEGINFIIPACHQISLEHDVTLDALSFVVYENPLISAGRELLYAKGLIAGLQGDPVIAAHLLIPQMENSLRHILKQNGSITSKGETIQDNFLLHEVLNSLDLKQILTENIIFTLKGLLVERMGSNLRNEICHGLFDYGQFFIPEVAYFWWLTLRLCLTPTYRQWADEKKEER